MRRGSSFINCLALRKREATNEVFPHPEGPDNISRVHGGKRKSYASGSSSLSISSGGGDEDDDDDMI